MHHNYLGLNFVTRVTKAIKFIINTHQDEISRTMTPVISPLAGASANQLNSPYSILKAKPAHIAEQMTYQEV